MKDLLAIAKAQPTSESRSKLKKHAPALAVLRYEKKWSCRRIAAWLGDPEQVGVENVVNIDQSSVWDFFEDEKKRERQKKLAQREMLHGPLTAVSVNTPMETEPNTLPGRMSSAPAPAIPAIAPKVQSVFTPKTAKSSRFAPSELLTNAQTEGDD